LTRSDGTCGTLPRVRTARAASALVASALAASALWPSVALAQVERQVNQFWPEFGVYYTLDERSRLYGSMSIARSREYATSTEGTYSIAYDRFAVRLPQWWLEALPNMDRSWGLGVRLGYDRIEGFGGGAPDENRLIGQVSLRSEPLLWGVQVSNRSRIDLRDIGGDNSWRYRNRSRIARDFAPTEALGRTLGEPVAAFGVRTLTPYAMVEFFWDSRDADWTRRFVQYGLETELRDGRGLELYLGIQDDDRASRSRVVAIGATFTLRF
jgi:hypothetical protein